LRVTVPIVFGRRHVLPVINQFLGRYPEVAIRLALLDRSVDLVEEGFDVAVRIGELSDTSAIATRVGALRRLLIAAPGYLERHGRPETPADLARHSTVAFVGIDGMARWTFAGGVEAAIKPRLIVNTAEAAIDAALSGFGITRVLSYQASPALGRGTLVRLLREHEPAEVPIHLVYPDGRHPPPKLRAFLDFVAPRLRQRGDRIARSLGDAS
jgi:DNA-binding transcriptional LysR family regulator